MVEYFTTKKPTDTGTPKNASCGQIVHKNSRIKRKSNLLNSKRGLGLSGTDRSGHVR